MLNLDEKKIRKGKPIGLPYQGSKKKISKKIVEIDRLFHWSSRLHQEQLQFVSKYPNVMEKYRQSN
ncbi:hypothetical protein HYP31_gp37 [Lactococcus phage 56003]|uniref:Uncharacterized protein n=1 Tax=Lactococcus phage 56003 TaxID=2029665 RepID=A0A343JPI4_9CAUD|nr:hypothetical protein HYP31_gp37 [Lactococcus phage 56003]ASZ71407.1 hypothetical protein 56003_37 [Lactococcus phage 56003]